MKSFHVGSHQFRESLRELLRELWFSHCTIRTSESTPYPDTCEKYRDTPPISIAILLQKYASSWQKVAHTPPICITIRLPFVSRYFCRNIRVRGRWDNPHTSRETPFREWDFAFGELFSELRELLQAVSKDGLSLKSASNVLRANKDIVLKAVTSNGQSLEFAAQELQGRFLKRLRLRRPGGW